MKRGLAPGDTFEDGGLEFVVVSVNADGSYSSTRTEETATGKKPAGKATGKATGKKPAGQPDEANGAQPEESAE